jgi:glutathione S-transferase
LRAFGKRDLSSLPNTRAYLARIGTRASYQRAMAKGDPDMKPLLA